MAFAKTLSQRSMEVVETTPPNRKREQSYIEVANDLFHSFKIVLMCAWNIWCNAFRKQSSNNIEHRKIQKKNVLAKRHGWLLCLHHQFDISFRVSSVRKLICLNQKVYKSFALKKPKHIIETSQTEINWNLSVKKSETMFLKTCKFRFYCRRFQGVSCLSYTNEYIVASNNIYPFWFVTY